MKECKILVSINLCLLILLNCLCPVAFAIEATEFTEPVIEESAQAENTPLSSEASDQEPTAQESVEQEATMLVAEPEADPNVVAFGL